MATTTHDLHLPTEDELRRRARGDVFRRAESYRRGGAVLSLARRGGALVAEVAGSGREPYSVRVSVDGNGRAVAECSCRYMEAREDDEWCKHIVAVVLQALREPEAVEDQPALDAVLAGLTLEQLRPLVARWAERDPDVYDQLCAAAARPDPGTALDAARRSALRRIRRAVHSVEIEGDPGDALAELEEVAAEARAMVEQGDAVTAVAVLDALTEECVPHHEALNADHSGRVLDLFQDVGQLWTEAVLGLDLSPDDRRCIEEKLALWDAELSDYGVDSFGVAERAAHDGWDEPRVAAALRGEVPDDEKAARAPEDGSTGDGEPGDWDDRVSNALAEARIVVLARQGRLEDALRLARAAHRDAAVADLLMRLGRMEEALAYAVASVRDTGETLALARRMWSEGAHDAALELAADALDRAEDDGSLAAWVRDRAADSDQPELALRAAIAAFRAAPDLDGWRVLRRLAGSEWPALRASMLDHLRGCEEGLDGVAEVYLHENLLADALDVVEDDLAPDDLAERVADAAAQAEPERVIALARRHAEGIMDDGRTSAYPAAARWLAIAKRAYAAAGRKAEWGDYLEGVIDRHRKKYTLRPLLEALRDGGAPARAASSG